MVVRVRRSYVRAAVAVMAVGVLLGAGAAWAALSSSSASGTIHACAHNQTGVLRLVASASDCRANETAVEWSRNGPIPVPQACPDGQFVRGIDGSGQLTCGTPAACGDGVVQGSEQCDASGESATCNLNCTAAACGDGVVNQHAGEQCDDGNSANGDGCSSMCKIEP